MTCNPSPNPGRAYIGEEYCAIILQSEETNTDRVVDSSTSSVLQVLEWDVGWNNSAPWWTCCSE